MSERLRIVEIATGIPGAVCGRLFAALGHEVIACEPPEGAPLRHLWPRNKAGEGLSSVALMADKHSVVAPADTAEGRRRIDALLDGADIVIIDASPARVRSLDLGPRAVRASRPDLIAVYVTACGITSAADPSSGPDEAALPNDSMLAEAYGGLATMVGDPDSRPLSLGGEQAAHAGGVTAFVGAMLALTRRDQGHGGDVVDVALTDVAAYMDWKSDVVLTTEGRAPAREVSESGGSRMVPAADGWVGAIFQHRHWKAVVDLVGDPALDDPAYEDQRVWLERSGEWWPIIERWIGRHPAKEVYERAQRRGLPFGWVLTVADLLDDDQLRARGFFPRPSANEEGLVTPVGTPVKCARLPWRTGRAPALGGSRPQERSATTEGATAPPSRSASLSSTSSSSPSARSSSSSSSPVPSRRTGGAAASWTYPRTSPGQLDGVLVLDFGTITAGAAVTRLLADYGATVLKIESRERPDLFRWWKGSTAYFPSNNIGKYGVAIDLKRPEGRDLIHRLAARAHVLVENFRVGVTEKLGIDAATLQAVNPDLIYLSLSSQGGEGPQARNISYGSTLDLLSGLGSLTGYAPDRPIWSSSNVNYPDQLVSLFGAAFVTYCLRNGITGAHLDVSQREVVSWTLAAQIADYQINGHVARASGNLRPGRAPHDVYPCAEPDRWVAIACETDEQRGALARCVEAPELADRPFSWWWDNQDHVDSVIAVWSKGRPREECVAALGAAGVPAVPVLNAADRAVRARFTERLVRLPGDQAVKGFPLRFQEWQPEVPSHTPELGEHTRQVLRDLAGISDESLDELLDARVIHQATR